MVYPEARRFNRCLLCLGEEMAKLLTVCWPDDDGRGYFRSESRKGIARYSYGCLERMHTFNIHKVCAFRFPGREKHQERDSDWCNGVDEARDKSSSRRVPQSQDKSPSDNTSAVPAVPADFKDPKKTPHLIITTSLLSRRLDSISPDIKHLHRRRAAKYVRFLA